MKLELLQSTASFGKDAADSYNGPFIPKLLPRWKVLLKLHTANIMKFERTHIQIRDAERSLRVTVGLGAAQPLLYCTVVVTHYTGPMQVPHPLQPPSLLLPERSLQPIPRKMQSGQIEMNFCFPPLHRLIGGKISRCCLRVWHFLIIKKKPNTHHYACTALKI